MPHIAIEAIKVKLDSNGQEVTYEPNTDMSTVAAGVLVEVAKVWDTDNKVETIIESGGHTSITPPSVPTVSSSTVEVAAPKDVVVVWSEDMKGSASIKEAINVIIDGGSAVHPAGVTFSATTMTLVLVDAVTAGQVVTWAYDDTHPTERLETVSGNIEADNQTYAITNNVV